MKQFPYFVLSRRLNKKIFPTPALYCWIRRLEV